MATNNMVTAVAAVLVAAFRRLHTRGAASMASYGLAGCKGILFANASTLAQGQTWPTTVTLTPNAPTGPQTLAYVGSTTPAGQPTRYNYKLAGVPGVWQVCSTWFGNAATAPATLGVQGVTLAVPTVSTKAASVTSAVVAAANVAQAAALAQAVATPPVVASVVAQGAAHVVAQAQAQAQATKGKGKATKGKGKGKATATA